MKAEHKIQAAQWLVVLGLTLVLWPFILLGFVFGRLQDWLEMRRLRDKA